MLLFFLLLVSHHFILFQSLVIVDRRVLVLLVFADQVVHVAFRLGELHLVHALAGIPVQEGLPPELVNGTGLGLIITGGSYQTGVEIIDVNSASCLLVDLPDSRCYHSQVDIYGKPLLT